jgi:hypothetical protein
VFGILLLIFILTILGATLVWIAGVVAREDVEIKTGVVILLLTGVLTAAAKYGLDMLSPGLGVYLAPVANFGLLVLFLHAIASLSWKHSAIIAAIYAVIITLATFGIVSCMASV